MPTKRNPLAASLLALALGVLVFAAGVALARQWLPEWRTVQLPEKRLFVERYLELARRAGARLIGAAPRVALATRAKDLGRTERSVLDRVSPEDAAALGNGLLVEVRQRASLPGVGPVQELLIGFLPSGQPWDLRWGTEENIGRNAGSKPSTFPLARATELCQLLLGPGESLGGAERGASNDNGAVSYFPVLGSRPDQRIEVTDFPGTGLLMLHRRIGGARRTGVDLHEDLPEILLIVVPLILGVLAVLAVFLVLLGKRRIDFVNGLTLAAILFVVAAAGLLLADPNWRGLLGALGAFFIALWALVLWSSGESFLRAVQPGWTVGLDALRAGLLGPRGGQALVEGVAFGALLAGCRLAAMALASRLPGVWTEDPSVRLPLAREGMPFFTSIVLASGVALALGLAYRFLPARWAPWAAALAAGLALPIVSLRPVGWQVAADVAAAGLLVVATRRAGLAALFAAALAGCLLPAAALAALHLAWLPISFALTAGVPVLLLALGLVGMRRPEWAERERLRQPAFMRRMEEERRLTYEMDLLARMQRELLPEVPAVAGWEIAVDSILATEAGGDLYDFVTDADGNLWIAAGDVAGHGYSCAIVQAMTAAALTSTITAAQTPSQVLREVDRVIRRGGAHRNFTSLALVRLDPRTGEALLGNAGHPFPLLLAHDGEVEEINLPGLPLGQGPQRKYADFRFAIPPGGALVFCSDGLFEATDPRGDQYGYDRPRDLLRALGDRPAGEILEALFADWRSYMHSDGPPADDTTVLVLKRVSS
ncbi:MAG TPA: SpoIIE family protein phosphatase [Thermoanaerobaculia bacterium]